MQGGVLFLFVSFFSKEWIVFSVTFPGCGFPPNFYIKFDYFLFDFSYIYYYIDNMFIDNTFSHWCWRKRKPYQIPSQII